MIDAKELIKRVGKREFVKMAVNSQKGQRMADIERSRRWGKGRKYMVICEHDRIIVRKYEPTNECPSCSRSSNGAFNILPDIEPHFNLGLGCYIESRKDLNRTAKDKGLVQVGDQRTW